jgi:type I restriction enzyme S subunit
VKRLGQALEKIDERIPGIDLPLMSVSQTRGVIRRSELTGAPQRAESLDAYKICRKGDIVFNKMKIRSGAMGVAPEDGLVTYHYEVMRPRDGMDARYIVYLMKSLWFTSELIARERGISAGGEYGGIRTTEVPFSVLRKIEVRLPEFCEQRQIADYLGRETARIDTLIEEQQRLIEMLRERRDSVWAAHVDEARRLGQILSVRRVIESIVDGPFGSSLTSAHYSDEGARVIRLGNIGVNEFKDSDAAFIPIDYAKELEAHAVEQGDVVVAGLGDDKMPLGRAAVVPALGPAIVKADCYRLRPNEQVSAVYLAWVMSAPQTRSQIMLLARGSTRARLNTKVVQQVEVPVPDRDVQDSLVTQSNAETTKIDRLVAEAEHFVELARERRAALITATVTGQIDAREMA